MAKRRKRKKIGIGALIAAVLLTAVVVFSALRLVHKCDNCDKLFFGTGYKPNAVVDIASDQQIICKECAEKQHAVSGFFGGDLKEYQYGLFEGLF